MKIIAPSLAGVILLSPAMAAVLISDNFDSVTPGGNIVSRNPSYVDPSFGALQWTSSTAQFLGNAAGNGLTATFATNSETTNRTIGLNLGSGTYFSDNQGVHEISLQIQRTGDSALSWLGLGFGTGLDVAGSLSGDGTSAGQPWMLMRMNGNVNVYRGPNTTNSLITDFSAGAPTTATTLTMRLDTSGTLWTLDAFVNGTAINLNGAAPGETFSYTANPSNLRYLLIGTGWNTSGSTANVDNFAYSFAPVPEPSTALLGALSGLTLLRRRR
jgi:hypothetical protein